MRRPSAHKLASRREAGYVWIDNARPRVLAAPFGGHQLSGRGREECVGYTRVKTVNVTLER